MFSAMPSTGPILKEFAVGPHRFSPNLILAPMSGVTNSAFRRLILRYNPGAVGLVVTEFISIEGLTRQNVKSRKMLAFRESERPISIQLFGYDIPRMVEAAKMVEDEGAQIVDINSGCPVPKVVKKGGGCELMRQPTHLGKMISEVKNAVSIPVTLKIRAGWDCNNRNALEVARVAEESGVSMLTVHGRTRTEMYRGLADWELVQNVATSLRIPVVGSGDICDYASARERSHEGLSGYMIGRAALANPWVFSEIVAQDRGLAFARPADTETVKVIEDYLTILEEEELEKVIIGRLKQFCSQVTRRVRGSARARKELLTSHSIAQFRERLARWNDELHRADDTSVDDASRAADSAIDRENELLCSA